MSPTQRSLKLLRSEGGMVAITEKWNQHARIRQDLFGFIDLLHVKGDKVVGVQTTSGSNVAARIAKIRGLETATAWLFGANRELHVHGWQKRGPRGKRKVWTCRKVQILPFGEIEL